MPFDEAVELARLIRAAPGWHVLGIEVASTCQPGAAAAWHGYLATHERYPHGETHKV